MKTKLIKVFAVWSVALLAAVPVLAQDGRHNTIADNSIAGPGGGTFNPLLTQPEMTLNNQGDIVFRSSQSGETSSLFFYDAASQAFSVIARTGDSAGGNGTLSAFSRARLNDSGDVAFNANLAGTLGGFTDDSAIYTWNATVGLNAAIREGVTSIDGVSTVGQTSASSLQGLFSSGEIGFNVDLVGAPNDSDWGAWRTNGTGFTQVVREQSTGDVGEPRVKFNGAGQSSLIMIQDDNVAQLRRDGAVIADASSTSNLTDFYQFVSGHNVIDDQGTVYFSADWTSANGESVLFRSTPGGFGAIATEGTTGPDGSVFGTFAGVGVATGSGQAVFANTTPSGGVESLFKFDGTDMVRVAFEGEAAPDGNGTFGEWGGLSETSNSSYAINNTGVVAFENFLENTAGGSSDDHGIFLTDGIETITAVREGSIVDGGAVSVLSWNGGRESDHQSSTSFNDYGQVAYRANVGGQWKLNLFTPDLHFRNPSDGLWDDNGNWTLSLEPNIVHDVFIDPDSYLNVSGPSGIATVRSLTIGGNGDAELNLSSGSVIDAQAGVFVLQDGVLSGDGSLTGETQSDGIIAAGNSAGELSFEDLTLLGSSRVEIELGGLLTSEFDRLLVSSDAILDGDLSVSLINGFELEDSMSFDFLQITGTQTGMFDGLNDGDLVGSFGGTQLFIDYHSGGVSLYSLSAVPEPNTLAIVGMLAMMVGIRRRRV